MREREKKKEGCASQMFRKEEGKKRHEAIKDQIWSLGRPSGGKYLLGYLLADEYTVHGTPAPLSQSVIVEGQVVDNSHCSNCQRGLATHGRPDYKSLLGH